MVEHFLNRTKFSIAHRHLPGFNLCTLVGTFLLRIPRKSHGKLSFGSCKKLPLIFRPVDPIKRNVKSLNEWNSDLMNPLSNIEVSSTMSLAVSRWMHNKMAIVSSKFFTLLVIFVTLCRRYCKVDPRSHLTISLWRCTQIRSSIGIGIL